MADATAESLAAWWRRAADEDAAPVVPNIKEWDAFIGRGDALFFSVAPHRAKLALFHDLTPEVGALVRAKAPEAVDKVWAAFETLCPTWHLQGEERQVHTGENYLDPPDFSLDAFRALAWVKGGEAGDLLRRLDVPFCRADLNYVTRLAVLSEGR